MDADYWREMQLVVPTLDTVADKQNMDIKFEASALDSVLTTPDDKIFPQDTGESCLLELRLEAAESGLLFKAYSIFSVHIKGIGDYYALKTNREIANILNDSIRRTGASRGVFGGKVDLHGTVSEGPFNYVRLQLGYVEFPKDSGIVYIFNKHDNFTRFQ